eukprot:gene18573-22739_t
MDRETARSLRAGDMVVLDGEVVVTAGLPTHHRLLETLRTEGFLRRTGLRDAYRLTLKVKSLSGGYKDDDWITDIADVELGKLVNEV